MENHQQNKAWIVTVSMGYGHQRTAYPLKDLSANGIINANHYEGMPDRDKFVWENSRRFYETISRFKRIPLMGQFLFYIFDKFQKILAYYPKRDLSKPTANLKSIFSLIKKGWGKNLIKTLSGNPLPLVTTFFTPAFMAEEFKYPGEIYCVICDADIARPWADLEPEKTRIKYFAPNTWTVERLKLYGVPGKNIFLTGYPLPKENIGADMAVIKEDLARRLVNLDPGKKYYEKYRVLVKNYVGRLPRISGRPLTLMFSVGGAGAQKEMCCQILKSLRKKIINGEIKIILSAGIKVGVRDFLLENVRSVNLEKELNNGVEILFREKTNDYFAEFNRQLRKTDILWTKPSELSFYAGLGLPIIIAPTIGSQEDFNRKWLLHIGAGILQDSPNHVDQWLFDLLDSGRFAEAAMQGFVEIEKMGTYNIEKIINAIK